MTAGFIILWSLVIPLTILSRSWRIAIIDYVGMQAKLVLVIIIKFIVPYNEFYS